MNIDMNIRTSIDMNSTVEDYSSWCEYNDYNLNLVYNEYLKLNLPHMEFNEFCQFIYEVEFKVKM